MPIRYIDENKEFEIYIDGTKCVIKQIYPQSDFVRIERARLKWLKNGDENELNYLYDTLPKFVVSIENKPADYDIRTALIKMTTDDLIELIIALISKSTFDKDEKKN